MTIIIGDRWGEQRMIKLEGNWQLPICKEPISGALIIEGAIGGDLKDMEDFSEIVSPNIKLALEGVDPIHNLELVHGKTKMGDITLLKCIRDFKKVDIFRPRMVIIGGNFKEDEIKFKALTAHYLGTNYSLCEDLKNLDWPLEKECRFINLKIDPLRFKVNDICHGFSITIKLEKEMDFSECYQYINLIGNSLSITLSRPSVGHGILIPSSFRGKIRDKDVMIFYHFKEPVKDMSLDFEFEKFEGNKVNSILGRVMVERKKLETLYPFYFMPLYSDNHYIEFFLYAAGLEGYYKRFQNCNGYLKQALEYIREEFLEVIDMRKKMRNLKEVWEDAPEIKEIERSAFDTIDRICMILDDYEPCKEWHEKKKKFWEDINIKEYIEIVNEIFKEFFDCVRITRNWIAHGWLPLKDDEKKKVINEVKSLAYTTEILKIIFKACLLNILGFDKEKIAYRWTAMELKTLNSYNIV